MIVSSTLIIVLDYYSETQYKNQSDNLNLKNKNFVNESCDE